MSELFNLMEESDDVESLKAYAEKVTATEYFMQEAWGFDRNSDFHKYWFTMPNCSCPTMDNEEMIGTKYRITSMECIIHGLQENTDET